MASLWEILEGLGAQMRTAPIMPDLGTARHRIGAYLNGVPISEQYAADPTGMGPRTATLPDYFNEAAAAIGPGVINPLPPAVAARRLALQRGLDYPVAHGAREQLEQFPVSALPSERLPYGTGPRGDVVNLTHYSHQQRDVLDPSQYGSRAGSAGGNAEYQRVTANPDVFRTYAYTTDYPHQVESMVGDVPHQFAVEGMYNIDRDLEGIKRAVRASMLRRQAQDPYGSVIAEGPTNTAIEREVIGRGYHGTYAPSTGHATLFEQVDLSGNAPDIYQLRKDIAGKLTKDLPTPNMQQLYAGLPNTERVGRGMNTPPKISKKTGKIAGAPGGQTKYARDKYRKEQRRLYEYGEPGVHWYPESGNAMMDMTSGKRELARRVANVAATTSPQTPVNTNLGHSIRAYNQHLSNMPSRAGRYPTEMGQAAEANLAGELPPGRKRSTFGSNIMKDYFPEDIPDGATIDLWMRRAGKEYPPQYVKDKKTGQLVIDKKTGKPKELDSVGTSEYNFMENEVNRLAKAINRELQYGDLDRTARDVQAGIWTGKKSEWEGGSPNANPGGYRDYINDYAGGITTESVPGRKVDPAGYEALTGRSAADESDIFPRAPEPVRADLSGPGAQGPAPPSTAKNPRYQALGHEYHRDLEKILTDNYGNSLVAREMGALQAGNRQGTGYYEGDYNPLTVSRPLVSKKSGHERTATVQEMMDENPKRVPARLKAHEDAELDPGSRALMDAIAITEARLRKQDAAAWNFPSGLRDTPSGVGRPDVDTVVFRGTNLGDDEMKRVGAWLSQNGYKDLPIVPAPDGKGGFAVLNTGPAGEKFSGLDGQQFVELIQRAQKEIGMDRWKHTRSKDFKVQWGKHAGGYHEAPDYEAALNALPSGLRERAQTAFSKLNPAVEEVRNWYVNRR